MSWNPVGNLKGPQGIAGPPGAQGAAGATGAPGTAGAAGSTWYTGAGVPSTATGIVGDFYLNSANGDYYKKTASATWTLQGNLLGPTGPQGAQGATGAPGQGVPTGGAALDHLVKNSAANYDTKWQTPPAYASAQVAGGATGTSSTTGQMAGYGAAGAVLTPTASGKVLVTFCGFMSNNGAGVSIVNMRWGTGTPPAANAAVVGTLPAMQNASRGNVGAGIQIPFSLTALVTGLALGTQVWFDLGQVVTAGALTTTASVTLTEIP